MFFISTCSLSVAYADFFKDQKISVDLRNFYIEREFKDVETENIGSWSQAFMGCYESGYTNTPIQLGVDASAQYALRLNNHNVSRADTIIPYDLDTGRQDRDYAKFGATLKLKYNKTELKIGELLPKNPIVYIDDSRQLLTTYSGAMLESSELEKLKITAGRVTRINARNDDHFRKLSLSRPNAPRYESDGLNLIGLDYMFNTHWTASYWWGQLEDIYRQQYLNFAYSTHVGSTKIKVDARYFHNTEDGQALYGTIDNQAYGVMTTLQDGNHTLMSGVRKNDSASTFPTLAGYVPQPYLHAWSNLGFVKPNELTWHVLYRYDFAELGMPGLKSTLRYLHGSDITREGFKDNKETEKSISLKYIVPTGQFKGIGLEVMHIRTDLKYGTAYSRGTDYNETRFIATYSYQF
ncbi:OprD family outer membrane porin [Acinetobacter soli]|uniref:Porin n=1 Tax=Acinetobacter soli TaxID=487316 RepID=A0A1P8EGT7_9GAMM|nr:OprD family outer membrane porin [Acinetobacter soli]APV35406.1 porin [Acinetobacter soli]